MSIRGHYLRAVSPLMILALVAEGPAAPPARGEQPAGSLLEEVLAQEPGLLGKVSQEQQAIAGKVRAEVEKDLSDARQAMAENPQQAEQNLKLTLERIESSPSLEPEVRRQLRQQVENAIRQARRKSVELAERKATENQQQAAAVELQRINDHLTADQQRLKQVMERFDALMDEGRYQVAANDVAPEVQRLAPGSSISASAIDGGQMQQMVHHNNALGQAREKNYLLALYQSELSAVPFPDEPPIVYMPPEKWEDLTLRRQKDKVFDLSRQGSSEQRILAELNKPTTIEFVEQPLKDAIEFLSAQHRIPIVLATKKLEEAGINIDTPITKNLQGITLRSALRLILKELALTYVVREEVLQITTPEDAQSQLITKVYPVGDLVVPIGNSGIGGLGGLGGLGAGGLGGGFNGGVGGGGFGGGGGGGVF